MKRYTQEQIDAADSIDLVAYAQSRGYELEREGNQHRMKEHDSLYLKDNHWYWFSHQLGGKAISFLMQYEGCSFVEAMQTLLGEKDINERPLPKASEISAKEPEPFELPTPSENSKAAYAYLCQRGISPKIISQYMKEGLIYQTNSFAYTDENGERAEKKCPAQVVFVGKDKDGEPKYACTRACFNEGKHDAPGSNKAYAFSIPVGENCKSVWVFESAIDLLSHMTLCSYSKKQYSAHRVSLGGCSPVALQRYLIDHPEIEYVNLGLDNDEQGRNAAENIKEMLKDSYKVYDHTPTFGKDFNEDLVHRQEQYKESHKEKDAPEPER